MDYRIEILKEGHVTRSVVSPEEDIHITLEDLREFLVPIYDEEEKDRLQDIYDRYGSRTVGIYDKQVSIYPDPPSWICKVSRGKFGISVPARNGEIDGVEYLDTGGVVISDPNNPHIQLRICKA